MSSFGVIFFALVLIAILWGILIMLPIAGWAVALILTFVIISNVISYLGGRKRGKGNRANNK
ncbi:MAG: hypothetical protein KAJ18_03215 [Candidatus Omnitrophica bacterium]|nr:hypothetical protein [Candidatus Omnitrophota bacterium]